MQEDERDSRGCCAGSCVLAVLMLESWLEWCVRAGGGQACPSRREPVRARRCRPHVLRCFGQLAHSCVPCPRAANVRTLSWRTFHRRTGRCMPADSPRRRSTRALSSLDDVKVGTGGLQRRVVHRQGELREESARTKWGKDRRERGWRSSRAGETKRERVEAGAQTGGDKVREEGHRGGGVEGT